MEATPGQLVHKLEVPNDFLKLAPDEIHHRFRVDLTAGAKLTKVKIVAKQRTGKPKRLKI
jgi:hypothetical protein